jgi:hypothetical protein
VVTKYVAGRAVTVSNNAGALSTFRVDLTFATNNISNLLASRTLSLDTNSFVNAARWRCASTQGTVVNDRALPAACQSDTTVNPLLPTA